MITFSNGGRIVQTTDELPQLNGSQRIFADFETTSGDPRLKSVDPFHDCDIAGLAITVDDEPGAWYIPIGHHNGANLPRAEFCAWWEGVVNSCEVWVNHNVKYDAHVSNNCAGVMPACAFYDTMNIAKVYHSDLGFRGGYGLDALSALWLKEDIRPYEKALAPYLHNNKDYGAIPIDICGEYACQDVLTARRLWRFLEANMPDQCRPVVETENRLTKVLFSAELAGMCVDPQQLKVKEYQLLRRLLAIDSELTELTGRSFRPHVGEDCFDVLCNQYGLPVLAWTESEDDDGNITKGGPSFDKFALAAYAAHPLAPPGVVELIQEYRKKHTLLSMFVTKYQERQVDGKMHPSYNQTVSTGRMSCKRPNAQQLSAEAKRLIIPPPGHAFISIDYSQIEFRLIVHYINDHYAIKAYEENPWTDFHTWVAELCQIARRPAKTMNFLMGYGGGKKLAAAQLSANADVVGAIQEEVRELVTSGQLAKDDALPHFAKLANRRAEAIYDNYHASLPSLKRTSRKAARACEQRGYVFNLYGRRRQLPKDKSHLAFNTLCQSSAADLMKERTVAVADAIEGTPIKIIASVHDETLLIAPTEIANDPRTVRDLAEILEHPTCSLRIPIKCDAGVSDVNWKEASSNSTSVVYTREECERLKWLM